MQRFRKISVRCGLAIWLFLFAMTADVIVKAIVSGGFHANNPVIQIEHKCAGNKGSVSAAHSVAPIISFAQVATEQVPISFTFEPATLVPQDVYQALVLSSEPPLRC